MLFPFALRLPSVNVQENLDNADYSERDSCLNLPIVYNDIENNVTSYDTMYIGGISEFERKDLSVNRKAIHVKCPRIA